ncbi:hypothetical protein T4B_7273 [Trichinella pseudospiralis]|uniref:Uncharacterized protein n=1 Tax=Trichinella pseudospiralis TaxID=6337 RepID=A0A0V1GKY9_TRIPS|nr:hypothetical protein T4B_450 [Trichinella pseudospiralis]KRY96049.1 hypothetical protein T4B_11910 [Trichinella pseudospiralis]KRY98531.1 hypothetical protein T4B_7273 [Trichinella pseudospiralis]
MDNNCDKEPKLCDLRLLQTIVRSKKEDYQPGQLLSEKVFLVGNACILSS